MKFTSLLPNVQKVVLLEDFVKIIIVIVNKDI